MEATAATLQRDVDTFGVPTVDFAVCGQNSPSRFLLLLSAACHSDLLRQSSASSTSTTTKAHGAGHVV